MIAAIYARYSSEERQRESALRDQIAMCRGTAARFGCEIADAHIYADEGLPGSVVQRPGYQRLMAAARDRAFDAILVEDQDRLWRSQAEMHAALVRLRHWGLQVFSAAAGAELTNKAGKVIATIIGLKDEPYLDDLRDKVRRGMLGQVQRGLSPGSRPYGYRSEPIVDSRRRDAYARPFVVGSRRVVDPEQAAVVRRIFELYTQGYSAKRIAAWLNERRIASPRGLPPRLDLHDRQRAGAAGQRNPSQPDLHRAADLEPRAEVARSGYRPANLAPPASTGMDHC